MDMQIRLVLLDPVVDGARVAVARAVRIPITAAKVRTNP